MTGLPHPVIFNLNYCGVRLSLSHKSFMQGHFYLFLWSRQKVRSPYLDPRSTIRIIIYFLAFRPDVCYAPSWRSQWTYGLWKKCIWIPVFFNVFGFGGPKIKSIQIRRDIDSSQISKSTPLAVTGPRGQLASKLLLWPAWTNDCLYSLCEKKELPIVCGSVITGHKAGRHSV